MSKWRFRMLCAVCLLSACEMNDFSDEEQEENVKVVVPQGHGEGTQAKPYTPSFLLREKDLPYETTVWVMGYVVGSTYQNMENACFDVSAPYAHNVLISNDSLCTNPSRCIPVELSRDIMQWRFSLSYQPDRLHQFVVLCGTLDSYYGQIGIRRCDAGYWIERFDLIRVAPSEDWDVVDKEF